MAGPLRDPGPRAKHALDAPAQGAVGREAETPADGAGVDAPSAEHAGGKAPPADGSDAEQPVEPLPDAPVGAVDEWSLDQLHRRASEVGLDGRWDMSREQLVEALREP